MKSINEVTIRDFSKGINSFSFYDYQVEYFKIIDQNMKISTGEEIFKGSAPVAYRYVKSGGTGT